MIKVYHIDAERAGKADEFRRNAAMTGSAEMAADLFWQGFYGIVAEIETIELETAWRLTNNVDTSWSMEPDPRVTVKAPMHEANGRTYGLRSSMMGDIFQRANQQYVVAFTGFTLLPAYDDEARLIQGWRESIGMWEGAAKELRAAGYGDNQVASPGGRSAAQYDALAVECRKHLAERGLS